MVHESDCNDDYLSCDMVERFIYRVTNNLFSALLVVIWTYAWFSLQMALNDTLKSGKILPTLKNAYCIAGSRGRCRIISPVLMKTIIAEEYVHHIYT